MYAFDLVRRVYILIHHFHGICILFRPSVWCLETNIPTLSHEEIWCLPNSRYAWLRVLRPTHTFICFSAYCASANLLSWTSKFRPAGSDVAQKWTQRWSLDIRELQWCDWRAAFNPNFFTLSPTIPSCGFDAYIHISVQVCLHKCSPLQNWTVYTSRFGNELSLVKLKHELFQTLHYIVDKVQRRNNMDKCSFQLLGDALCRCFFQVCICY